MDQLLKVHMKMRWEDRLWLYSMQATKPFQAYAEMIASLDEEETNASNKIDELPKVQQDWLRKT